MTDEAKRLLRRRMIKDMTIRKIATLKRIATKTLEGYIRTVSELG